MAGLKAGVLPRGLMVTDVVEGVEGPHGDCPVQVSPTAQVLPHQIALCPPPHRCSGVRTDSPWQEAGVQYLVRLCLGASSLSCSPGVGGIQGVPQLSREPSGFS